MDQARRLTAEFAQSDAFLDLLINGIAPDGSPFARHLTGHDTGIGKSLIYWRPRCCAFVPANRATPPKTASSFTLASPALPPSVVFLEIHPFQDGNGRLSRVLTNLSTG